MNDKTIITQKATDYILYMIVGSYFKSTTCTSRVRERQLFLYYKDLNLNKQYKIEEKCIQYVEKKLLPNLPSSIWNEDVTVTLKPDKTGFKTEVIFAGKGWSLDLTSECLGNI